MNLPREIVVPVECQAKDHGHDFKLFTLVKKEDGWIQPGLRFCGVNTPEREGQEDKGF